MGPAVVAVHRVGVARFHVSAGVVDLAVTGRTVWVAGFGAVTRLDPVTGATVARIETPGVGDRSSIAAGERGVWVSAADRGVVYRIATDTDRVVAAIHVGGLISAVAVGGGQVWVTRVTQTLGNVVRIDPRTDQVTGDPITVGPGPDELVYAHAVGVGSEHLATVGDADRSAHRTGRDRSRNRCPRRWVRLDYGPRRVTT